MFTMNFNKYVFSFVTGYNDTYYRSSGSTFTGFTDLGCPVPLGICSSSNAVTTSSLSFTINSRAITSNFGRMILGTDATAEDYNDYAITADTSLTMVSYSCTAVEDEDAGTTTITNTKIVSNDTDEDIEINEVGLFGGIGYSTSGGTGQTDRTNCYSDILFYRHVFNDTIIIPADNARKFTLKFTVNRDFTVTDNVEVG